MNRSDLKVISPSESTSIFRRVEYHKDQNAEMDPHRRVTRSTSNVTRNTGETEGAFWGRMIDPTDIERGQAEAIRAARRATSDNPSALLNTTQDEQSSQVVDNNQKRKFHSQVT